MLGIASAQLLGVLTCAVGLLILFAGISKLFYLQEFRQALLYVPHLPMRMIPLIALVVPAAEMAAAIGLLLLKPWGIAMMVALLAITSGVAVLAWARNQQVPCVCFTGSSSENLSLSTVGRNAVFAGIAVLPAITPTESFTSTPLIPASALAAIFIYLSLEYAITNAAKLSEYGRFK